MRSTVRLVSALVLAASALIAPTTSASADPSKPPGQNGSNAALLQACYDKLASGEFSDALTFGRCVGFNSVSDEGSETQFCQFLKGEDLLSEFGFTSFSDCVVNLH